MSIAITAQGLAKSFGGVRALCGVDLEVEAGTVLGLLGRNGAGKTTAVRMLATLLRPSAGRAEVGGYDVVRQPRQVRRLMAVSLGFRFGSGPVAALAAVALAVAFGVALSWVAATVGLVVRNPETAQAAGFLWMFPLTFASSAYAPADTMPGWLQPFVEANPISVASDALRALLTGGPARTSVLWSLAWIAGIVLVFAPLVVDRYRRLA